MTRAAIALLAAFVAGVVAGSLAQANWDTPPAGWKSRRAILIDLDNWEDAT